ncbi:MAG: hypothetical protein TH68_02045 [Candidatus Synechococcus spongiarum 142]|uniref:Uncharacterized protein n=1 Tax=Candidatus Synechococcus spongiarum 142 TaxID=1608213 RepID=A0A6N3X9N5_9SYNE|nr:MAG: hypothetical protein TH68_02045 [Candidatus Synechococcus spongiarum 142]
MKDGLPSLNHPSPRLRGAAWPWRQGSHGCSVGNQKGKEESSPLAIPIATKEALLPPTQGALRASSY